MSRLANNGKLAAVNRDNQEEHPRKNFLRDTNAAGFKEEYFRHVSEEIGCRMAKKISQEFNRTESRILGALSNLVDFFLNSPEPLQDFPGTLIVKTRNIRRIVPRKMFFLKLVIQSIDPVTQWNQSLTQRLTLSSELFLPYSKKFLFLPHF